MRRGPGEYLGAVVLAALEEGPAHGYLIARRVSVWTAGDLHLREGSLYPVLHVLEVDGLVSGTVERHGERERRVYCLTNAGRARLAHEREQFRRETVALNRVILRDPKGETV